MNRLEKRISDALDQLLKSFETKREFNKQKTKEFSDVIVSYEVTNGKHELPQIIYGLKNSSGFILDKKKRYYAFGKLYERLFSHSYESFLKFSKISDDETLKGCRLMFVPDWPHRSLYRGIYGDEFKEDVKQILDKIGLNEFMKVDILY